MHEARQVSHQLNQLGAGPTRFVVTPQDISGRGVHAARKCVAEEI